MENREVEVLSVNISEKKGTVKKEVEKITLFDKGVKDDAHSGSWNRMVSLLGMESVKKFEEQAGRKIAFGEFAENITTEGIELFKTHPLDRFVCGEIVLEVTQIGKSCHGDSCAIFREVGNCVMPKEGIFARVIQGGEMKAGDKMEYFPRTFNVEVITLSDRAFAGEYEDRSGPRVTKLLEEYFEDLNWNFSIENHIIPDSPRELEVLIAAAEERGTDVIITTGGTGIGPRDFTVDVVKPMLDKEIPGIMELIRMKYGQDKPQALISRGVAGVINESLVFTLPGSVKAVNEYMPEITNGLKHMIYMIHSIDAH